MPHWTDPYEHVDEAEIRRRVWAHLSRFRPGEEIDAWGMARAIGLAQMGVSVQHALDRLVSEGRAYKDGNWYGLEVAGVRRNPHVDDSFVLERYTDGSWGAYPFGLNTPMVARSRSRIVYGATATEAVQKLEEQEGRKLQPWTYREREALERERVRRNPRSCREDDKCRADMNKVLLGVVFDPDELHPIAREEWERQRREATWGSGLGEMGWNPAPNPFFAPPALQYAARFGNPPEPTRLRIQFSAAIPEHRQREILEQIKREVQAAGGMAWEDPLRPGECDHEFAGGTCRYCGEDE